MDLASIFERPWWGGAAAALDPHRPLTWAPPEGGLPFGSNRWRRVADALREGDGVGAGGAGAAKVGAQWRSFGRWVCRAWTRRHGTPPSPLALRDWRLCFTFLNNSRVLVDPPGAPLPIIRTECLQYVCHHPGGAAVASHAHAEEAVADFSELGPFSVNIEDELARMPVEFEREI